MNIREEYDRLFDLYSSSQFGLLEKFFSINVDTIVSFFSDVIWTKVGLAPTVNPLEFGIDNEEFTIAGYDILRKIVIY